MDSNGYNPSIMQRTQGCYFCHKGGDLARHEVFFGVGTRKLSKMLGLWVHVCPVCHSRVHDEITYCIKDGKPYTYDDKLKDDGEMVYKMHYTVPFEDVFGKGIIKPWEIEELVKEYDDGR